MADKITVYVDGDLHRRLKAVASAKGMSLSDFVVQAARRALSAPSREEASRQMDRIRSLVEGTVTESEIRAMRDEGRRF